MPTSFCQPPVARRRCARAQAHLQGANGGSQASENDLAQGPVS